MIWTSLSRGRLLPAFRSPPGSAALVAAQYELSMHFRNFAAPSPALILHDERSRFASRWRGTVKPGSLGESPGVPALKKDERGNTLRTASGGGSPQPGS